MLLFLLVFFFAVNRASVGGFEGFDDVHQMPFGRSDMTATLFAPELFDDDLGARIYLVGGCAADQECPTDWGGWCFCPELTARCEYYSPDQDIWVDCASAPRERYRFAAAEVNGKLYIVGGRDVMDQIVTEVDVYDPVSDTWATPYVWEDATSDNGVFADGDDLYLVGGYDQNYTVAHNSLTKLSTIDFIAETLSSMSTGRGDLGVISVPESDGSSSHYAIGGAGVDFCTMLNTVESYDIASDTWIILGVLTLPRADMALGVIDSELFVIAGETKDDSCDYSIFNPGESIPVSDVERFVQFDKHCAIDHERCRLLVVLAQACDPSEVLTRRSQRLTINVLHCEGLGRQEYPCHLPGIHGKTGNFSQRTGYRLWDSYGGRRYAKERRINPPRTSRL